MNPVELQDLGGKLSARDAASRPNGEASTAQDRLWQQAMHQAQQQGFAGWFAGPSPGGTRVPDAAPRPLPDAAPSGPRAAMTWSRSDAGQVAVAPPSQPTTQAPIALPDKPPAAKPTPIVRSVVESLEASTAGHGAMPVAFDASVEFGSALNSAFARSGVSVSTGSWLGTFSEQSTARATSDTRPPSSAAVNPKRLLSSDEVDLEPVEAESLPPTSSSIKTSSPSVQPSDPLRVHAEWSSAGVRVWLGAEAAALDAAHALASRLQEWLANRGERLLSLVCNGRAWPSLRQRTGLSHANAIDSYVSPTVNSPSGQEAP